MSTQTTPDVTYELVPLGPKSAEEVADTARELYPRRRNWESPEPIGVGRPQHVISKSHGRYSSSCPYTRYSYVPVVQSYAAIISGEVHFFYGYDPVRILPQPHGYRWDTDNLGIVLIKNSNGDDYHPDSDDFRFSGVRAMTRRLRDNAAVRRDREAIQREKARKDKRQQQKTKKLLAQAKRDGVCVTLQDSIRAGNCRAGTTRWAQQHNLDKTNSVPIQDLFEHMDDQRVMIAAMVAIRRHKKDMERGYCEIR